MKVGIKIGIGILLCLFVGLTSGTCTGHSKEAFSRPNILVAISDDQSYPHAEAYGSKFVETPVFDELAKEGVLFMNAFAPSPGCSPSRAAFLTGRNPWQIEHAGTHASSFSSELATFPERLEGDGYVVGFTGKGWAPGNFRMGGRERNPAGTEFNEKRNRVNPAISEIDYSENFRMFLDQKAKDAPFCFWYGAKEPHRKFDAGVGLRNGGRLEDVYVPEFLPDTETVRSELLDYAYEINWFDTQLGKMLEELEKRGERRNTIVIVTSDNGMAFPRAKANCYEFGIHIPLTISWPREWKGGRVCEDLVSLIDLTPTLLEAAGHSMSARSDLQGRSLLPYLIGSSERVNRDHVLSGRERHSSSRFGNLGYPQRSLRTKTHLLVWNCAPDRWPAGSPVELGKEGERLPVHAAYYDIDRSPSLSELVDLRDIESVQSLFGLAVGKRPEFELYDIRSDPSCVSDLSSVQPELTERLKRTLMDELSKQEDPRLLGEGDVWETYERYGTIRSFPKPSAEN